MPAGARGSIARLSHPTVVWIGLISYPLYLWHWPLLSFARIVEGGVPPAALRLALLGVSVGLAWMTYRVDRAAGALRLARRAAVPALAIAMLARLRRWRRHLCSAGFIDRPINRSDAARLVDYYERMRKTDLRTHTAAECDFMDWQSEGTRDAIDPSCTEAGRARTVLSVGRLLCAIAVARHSRKLPAGYVAGAGDDLGMPAADR